MTANQMSARLDGAGATQEIDCGGETWKVAINGKGETKVIDSQGRLRFRGRDHMMTAVHFAMALSRLQFASSAQTDELLRAAAEETEGER